MLSWILCAALSLVCIALIIKICVMRKSMTEICKHLEEHLFGDTNHLITVSSGDRYVRALANKLNYHLRVLRKQRRQYLNGDKELKDAVTNISHDLRTPLTAICGYLELLSREECSDEVKRYVEQIRNRSEALKKLTEELFRYSVISSTPSLTYENIDVSRVLERSLVSFYAAMRQRGIEPTISLPGKPVWRELNESALMRIWENIIGNAVKYSDGDLSVTLEDDGTATFSNTAKSLSSVDVGKLFDRFYTVDTARQSTGLGLSIAKLLVERMNGSISAEYHGETLTVRVKL